MTTGGVWRIGEVIDGLYEVMQIIETGGMGTVHRVWHRGWNLELAVKSVKADLLVSPQAAESFEAEARSWVELGLHPNTVACAYVRRMAGIPRVFAEWVDGGSLAEAISGRRLYVGSHSQVLARLLDTTIQFAWGLGHAHANGLIHQDVKPANAMLTASWTLKVTDFGLAGARAAATAVAATVGVDSGSTDVSIRACFGGMTPAYSSPEQDRAAHEERSSARPTEVVLTRATDTWSWAASILEMFLGERVWFAGPAAGAALELLVDGDAVVADPRIPPIPMQLVELLRECFSFDPTTRPKQMDAVADHVIAIYESELATAYPRQRPAEAQWLADSLSNKALSMLDLGHPEESNRLWEQAVALDPHHVHTLYNKGLHAWRHARTTDDRVLAALDSAAISHPGASVDFLIGSVHVERGDDTQARAYFTRAADADPSDPVIARSLAKVVRGSNTDPAARIVAANYGEGVAVSADGKFYLLDARTNALSADGELAVAPVRHDTTADVFRARTGESLRTLRGHSSPVTAVAISGDGSVVISTSADNTVRVWAPRLGTCLRVFDGQPGVQALALNRTGTLALFGGWTGEAFVWDLANGRMIGILRGHRAAVNAVTLNDAGTLAFTASADMTVLVWDVATGNIVTTLIGHAGAVGSVAVSDDGTIALTGGTDNTARLWDTRSGRCLRTMTAHTRSRGERMLVKGTGVSAVALSGDGQTALTASRDDTRVLVWTNPLPHHSPVAWSYAKPRAANEVATEAEQVRARLHRTDQLIERLDWRAAADELNAARRIPGYQRHPEILQRWRALSRAGNRTSLSASWQLTAWQTPCGEGSPVAISPDGEFVLAPRANTVAVWSAATGELVRTLDEQGFLPWSVAISPDGALAMAGGADDDVWIWDLASGASAHRLPGHTENVRYVAFSSDSRLAITVDWSATIRIWSTTTGALRHHRELTRGTGSISCVAVRPSDFGVAVTGGRDWQRCFYDVGTGDFISNSTAHLGSVSAVAFDMQGTQVASGGEDASVRVLDLRTQQTCELTGHTGPVESVGFSLDGRLVLSGARDGTARLWDIATTKCVRVLGGDLGAVQSVGLSSDAHVALTTTRDNTVRTWAIDWNYEFPMN